MWVALCLFITLVVFLNSVELSSEARLRELFPASASYDGFLPPIKRLAYAKLRQQLSHLRRLDARGRITRFNSDVRIQRRGSFVIGWVLHGILNPLYGWPCIYDMNGTKIEVTGEELEQLGVNHLFSFVRLIDDLAAQRRVAITQVQAALPVKIAAHYEASITANFRAMHQSKLERQRLPPPEGRTYEVNNEASTRAISYAYNEAYDVTLQNYLRVRGNPS